jgi:hypothetical protein
MDPALSNRMGKQRSHYTGRLGGLQGRNANVPIFCLARTQGLEGERTNAYPLTTATGNEPSTWTSSQ